MKLWTRQQDEDLRELCKAEELSYGSIAMILSRRWHRSVTRSAVGQRARRLALRVHTRRCDMLPETSPEPEPERWKPPEDNLPDFRTRLGFHDPDSDARGMLMLNAGVNDCRWPVGGRGPTMRVCGERTKPGSSYCEACHRLAYVPTREENRGAFVLKKPSEMREWRRLNLAAEKV